MRFTGGRHGRPLTLAAVAAALALTAAALVAAVPAVAAQAGGTVSRLSLSGAEQHQLLGLYARYRHVPAADVARTALRSAEGARTAAGTDWAAATYVPAQSAPLSVRVGFQDGGDRALFTRAPGKMSIHEGIVTGPMVLDPAKRMPGQAEIVAAINGRTRSDAARFLDARRADQFHKRLPAAIQDGHFQVVDFDKSVIDTHAVKHTQQVFGGGDQDTRSHQAGGVADFLHVSPTGRDAEAVQIRANENDACRGRRR